MTIEVIKQPPIMGHAIEIEIITGAVGISNNFSAVKITAKRGFYKVKEYTDVIENKSLFQKRRSTLMLLWLTMGKMLYEELFVEETSNLKQSA